MKERFTFGGKEYAPGNSLIIAELSANHNGSYQHAVELVHAAVEAGADAIKVQTYTADSMTLRSHQKWFQIEGTIWDGQQLYDVYEEASMPWDWQPKLAQLCREKGVHFFSSPFDAASVDFLEEIDVPAYKIASFELVDIPLIEKAASTGKSLIMSTGMATRSEIEEAVVAARNAGAADIALLKCTSAYPSPYGDMNLRTIPDLAHGFDVVAGLSDHTMGIVVPVAAVSLGAGVIEKHFTLARSDGGVDSTFSLEAHEFREMVDAVRATEEALGGVKYGGVESEKDTRKYRRSLFVTEDIAKGEVFTEKNIRAIRPGAGLEPKYFREVLGKTAGQPLEKGTPLSWDLVEEKRN